MAVSTLAISSDERPPNPISLPVSRSSISPLLFTWIATFTLSGFILLPPGRFPTASLIASLRAAAAPPVAPSPCSESHPRLILIVDPDPAICCPRLPALVSAFLRPSVSFLYLFCILLPRALNIASTSASATMPVCDESTAAPILSDLVPVIRFGPNESSIFLSASMPSETKFANCIWRIVLSLRTPAAPNFARTLAEALMRTLTPSSVVSTLMVSWFCSSSVKSAVCNAFKSAVFGSFSLICPESTSSCIAASAVTRGALASSDAFSSNVSMPVTGSKETFKSVIELNSETCTLRYAATFPRSSGLNLISAKSKAPDMV